MTCNDWIPAFAGVLEEKTGMKVRITLGEVHSKKGTLALWTRSETVGSAVKDVPGLSAGFLKHTPLG